MSEPGSLNDIVKYWIEKSRESFASAKGEFAAGRLSFAVNRLYYSCFYLASAILLKNGRKFKKHSGVRAAFHQNFVKPGFVDLKYGLLYDELFEARQRGDYIELVRFEAKQVEGWLALTREFLEKMGQLFQKNL